MSDLSNHAEHPLDDLPEYVRGESANGPEIDRHLDRCESCRTEVEILRVLSEPPAQALSEADAERVYRSFETRRLADLTARGTPGPRWLRVSWRLAAGFAVLLTSVGVWRVVQTGSASGWDPDVAVEGFVQDLAGIDLSAGEVRLALGVGLADPELDPVWDAVGEGDVEELAVPWETDR